MILRSPEKGMLKTEDRASAKARRRKERRSLRQQIRAQDWSGALTTLRITTRVTPAQATDAECAKCLALTQRAVA